MGAGVVPLNGPGSRSKSEMSALGAGIKLAGMPGAPGRPSELFARRGGAGVIPDGIGVADGVGNGESGALPIKDDKFEGIARVGGFAPGTVGVENGSKLVGADGEVGARAIPAEGIGACPMGGGVIPGGNAASGRALPTLGNGLGVMAARGDTPPVAPEKPGGNGVKKVLP